MVSGRVLICFALLLSGILVPVLAQDKSATPQPAAKHAPAAQRPQSYGERVFQQNCARCHKAPDGFSPRIAGAITRHMRVRASLSKRDEEAVLRFFNP